jgi:hypothetical protein
MTTSPRPRIAYRKLAEANAAMSALHDAVVGGPTTSCSRDRSARRSWSCSSRSHLPSGPRSTSTTSSDTPSPRWPACWSDEAACRQLASRARKAIRTRPARFAADPDQRQAVTQRFLDACAGA